MKKLWDKLVELHWKAFMENAAYFLLTLPIVGIYFTVRKAWYLSQGKNFYGQTPEEEAQELKKEMEDNPFGRYFTNW